MPSFLLLGAAVSVANPKNNYRYIRCLISVANVGGDQLAADSMVNGGSGLVAYTGVVTLD